MKGRVGSSVVGPKGIMLVTIVHFIIITIITLSYDLYDYFTTIIIITYFHGTRHPGFSARLIQGQQLQCLIAAADQPSSGPAASAFQQSGRAKSGQHRPQG